MTQAIKIADVRHTLTVPGNSLAAVVRAAQYGFREVLVEPVFANNGDENLNAFLGDYPQNIRLGLYQQPMADYFAENRLVETPEPLSGVLYVPGLTRLWCLFTGPDQYAAAAAKCLIQLGCLMPDLSIGFLSLTNPAFPACEGLAIARPARGAHCVVLKRAVDHLFLLFPSFRKRAISLAPWPLGSHRHLVSACF